MRPRSNAEALTARPRLRRWTASVMVLSIVILPVLFAFVHLDAAPAEVEIARVEQAFRGDDADVSQTLVAFYGSYVRDDLQGEWRDVRAEVTKTARIAGMLALFGISALLYVLLLLVRGRATAAVGCLTLCLLPPFADEGYVLRAEQCATMFGLLGIVLISGFPLMLQDHRTGFVSRWLPRLCLMVVVGITFGLARTCHDGGWIYLTIPAAALLLSVMAAALVLPRASRGKPWIYWPMRAAARRYVPWMGLVIATFGLTLWMLIETKVDSIADSRSGVGVFPGSLWLSVPLMLFGLVGAVRMTLGVGLRINRMRRVRPDTVLFLYVAAMWMQFLVTRAASTDGQAVDRLPLVPACACLVADGVMTVLIVGVTRWRRQRG